MPGCNAHSASQIWLAVKGLESLSSVHSYLSARSSFLLFEACIDSGVGVAFFVNNVSVVVVGSAKQEATARTVGKREFVKHTFGFVQITQLFVNVVAHLQRSHVFSWLPYVPDFDRNVVARINVVFVSFGEDGWGNGVDDVCEEMLLRGVFVVLEDCGAVLVLAVLTQVAHVDAPFRLCK